MKKENIKVKQPIKDGIKRQPNAAKKQTDYSYFNILALAIISLLGIVIYSNSFNCSFQFDDAGSIVNNKAIRNLVDVKTIWNFSHNRFIPYLTFAINYHYGELNVWGYHLFNLIIHIITSGLIYWLTLLLFSTPSLKNNSTVRFKNSIALFTALLFVSHPLATQSVTYIVQRMASIVAMFYLLSLALYVKSRLTEKSKLSKYLLLGGSLISALLALLSKENAYTLPLAFVLFEMCFFQTQKLSINSKVYRIVLILVAFAGFSFVVLNSFSYSLFKTIPPDSFNDYQTITSLNYLLTQFSVIVKYIQLLILPIHQNFDYDYQVSNSFFDLNTLLGFIVLMALVIASIFLYNKNRIVSFGIIWFLLTIAVESSIIPLSDLIFEHRTYLPSYGFFLILSYSLFRLYATSNKYQVVGFFAILIGANSYLTFERNKVWKNELSFWADAAQKSPLKARPHFNLANTYYKEKNSKDALVHFNEVIKLKPNYYGAYYNRAILFESEKNSKGALSDYNKAIELNPIYIEAYFNRGNLFKNRGQLDAALIDYSKVITLKPDFAKAYYNRAVIYVNQKKLIDAIADLTKLIELHTEDEIESYYNRGMAYYFAGNKDNCCKDLQVAVNAGYQSAVAAMTQFCKK